MKKKLEFSIILLTIVFSSFGTIYRAIPSAKATYVEGVIAQDTDWTLVDSPIVLSGNVSVNPGITLAIEPGVNVRFGEDFSLIVSGRIVANGIQDKLIQFTSNRISPSNGDWGTILLDGTEQSSLTYCSVEYGTMGIIVEKGFLNIQDSLVRYSSENGITINDGEITLKNNEITNNTMSGICITGGTQVDVENNNIRSNGDGLTLVGNLIGEIIIERNNIMSNGQSGITLSSDAYDNIRITENNISTNLNGFHVINSTSTYITRNYIFSNSIGIYYEGGNNHEAHFNDIYDNALGMDVSSTANVDATYNYWGHKSGPFHASLNPHGEGNPVAGNGVNLDFIFFLSAAFNHTNTIPKAVLTPDKVTVTTNQTVTFMGTNSFDEGRVDQYFFDFGDGTNSSWITTSLVNHTYPSAQTYTASLKVIDDFNATSDATAATITVLDPSVPALTVLMTLNNETVNYNENVSIIVHVSNESGDANGANVTLFSLKGGSFSPVSGITSSDGQFSTTFTAPYVTEISDIRLIARASAAGYADGSDHEYLKVLPPLTVQMTTAKPGTLKSEETTAMTVNVTDAFGQPVEDALLTLQYNNGIFSPNTGSTDADGGAMFNFTAPSTLTEVNITVTVTAAKSGFADGQIQKVIIIEPKILVVGVTADPFTIVSEATSNITALVTSDGNPVSDATVNLWTDSAGNFALANETTDSNGIATFLFHAAQTTTEFNVTVTAAATKTGYVDGEAQTVIVIEPKRLMVEVASESLTTISETNVTVTVRVKYDAAPIEDVNVTVTSESGGSFYQPNGSTDASGIATFTLAIGQLNTPTNITISAYVSKTGYVDDQNSLKISINPGILNVRVDPGLPSIMSGNSATVYVYVTANATPVSGARVTISTSVGNFSTAIDLTDSNGKCAFVFNAPTTAVQLPVVMIANVTRNGYIGSGNQTTIYVLPEEIVPQTQGGLPLIALLLMAIIPVVIAVIVVVLIKLKVIVIFTDEE